jgi:SAM-dependent methyltransferase
MSQLGEFVLRNLVARREGKDGAKPDTHEAYHRWQFESCPSIFGKYPDFSPRSKTILEIGCGIGGRSAWLATQGAARVVAIDINAAEIAIAIQLRDEFYPALTPTLEYLVSGEDAMLDIGQFDYVLMVDMMEHVVSPPAILGLAHAYTKAGGACYFSTFGWYHHSGSHTGLIPWANLFFSDETLINVTRWKISRPEYKPSRFDSPVPVDRWKGIYNLRDRPDEHLNKITLAEVRKILRYNIFRSGHMVLWPIGGRPAWLFRALIRIPYLDEVFHGYFVVRLEKADIPTAVLARL